MPNPRPKGILFDLDGTLVDSLDLTFEAFNFALRKIGKRDHSPEEILIHFGPGEKVIFGKLVGNEFADEAFSHYQDFFLDQIERASFFQGIPEMLTALAQTEIKMGIFTGRGATTTAHLVKHHQLDKWFDPVLTHDDVSKPKPHPEGVIQALNHWKVEPSEIWMVGDSVSDLKAAHSAFAVSVHALWDKRTRAVDGTGYFSFLSFKHPHDLLLHYHSNS